MLAKRIIPCLDVKNGRVVKGINFIQLRDAGDPVEQAAAYSRQGADELVFLDITASHEHRSTMLDVVRRTAEQVFIPFTVGGGIRAVADMEMILRHGADKISINTAALSRPALVREGARQFGNQCVVVAIDAKRYDPAQELSPDKPRHGAAARRCPLTRESRWQVYSYGGRVPTGIDALSWARYVESLGAGELLLTSMDCDGTLAGYDIALTAAVAHAVRVPVIASGGAGTLAHLYEGLTAGQADAVLAASIFHYGTFTIKQVKRYLRRRGLIIRAGDAVPVKGLSG